MSRALNRDELVSSLIQQLRIQSTVGIFMHQAIAERLGLNTTDHKCMELLQRHGSMTAGELARESNLTTGAITGVIDRLEKAEYVHRVKDPNDRRRLTIQINPESFKKFEGLFQSLREETIKLLDKYSDEDLRVLVDFIKESTKMSSELTKKFREG